MGMLPGKNLNLQKFRNGILGVMGYFASLCCSGNAHYSCRYSTLYSNYLEPIFWPMSPALKPNFEQPPFPESQEYPHALSKCTVS